MGERAKIMLNEYTAKALLKRDDLDLDKFYSTDIKMMVKVAQQELKKKDNIINELEKELREGSFDVYFCSTNTQKTFKSNEIIIKSLILDKLKELKEE